MLISWVPLYNYFILTIAYDSFDLIKYKYEYKYRLIFVHLNISFIDVSNASSSRFPSSKLDSRFRFSLDLYLNI